MKLKNFCKKNKAYLLSFFIPIFVMIIVCVFNKIAPFGDFSFAKYDGYYQYIGFTSYFKNVLLGKASLFYSFKGLLGYNFYATAIYYLFNPTNILCIFFNGKTMLDYYSLIVILRIGLCGLTMCIFLKYKYNEKENTIFQVLFSVAYALMGYNVFYFFNYMYFDTVVLLPIVIIGLEKLIYKNDIKLYMVSLTISIISNFYIGYMVCIFCLLYFIYSYILLEKKNRKIIYNFILCSVLCGLMCTIILLPEMFELTKGKVDLYNDVSQTKYFGFNLNFLNIFYKSSPGSAVLYDMKFGTVNIYCSLLVFIMVIKYFFNSKISVKEKIVTGSLVAFYLLCISFNLLDYFWQFMQRPIWYPNRYIFTFSFFLITIGYKSFINKESINLNLLTKIIIIIIYILLMMYPAYKAFESNKLFQIVCLILSFMIIVQYVLFTENKYATVLLVGIFFIEVTLNAILTNKLLSNPTTYTMYKYTYDIYNTCVNNIKEDAKNEDFYRMEFSSTFTYNSGALFNYNGINIFDSLRNGKVMNFFGKYFDMKVNDSASMSYDNRNPYITSILGVKYIDGKSKEFYHKKVFDSPKPVYRNEDALNLAFMINNDSYDSKFIDKKVVENTVMMIKTMLGKDYSYDDILYKFDDYEFYNVSKEYDDAKEKYVVRSDDYSSQDSYVILEGIAQDSGFLFTDDKIAYYNSLTAKLNDEDISTYFSGSSLPLFINKGDKYYFKFKSTSEYDYDCIQFYLFKYDVYNEFITEMKKNEFNIEKYYSDSHFKGIITSTEEKNVLFTSIPYDKGWNIYVDGIKTQYNMCYDTFICLDLNSGNHEIEFKYIPRGFIVGAIVSFIAFITSIYFIIKNKVH